MTEKKQLFSNKQSSAWQQTSTRVVYENPWIELRHDTVITPAKTEGIYGVVHFKNHAVGVLPIDSEGYTWLVQQTRYVFGRSTWEIPEGGCPLGESVLAAAKRELTEETGLDAESWDEWLTMDLSNSVTDERATVFIAQELVQGDSDLEPTEDIMVRRLPLREAVEMVSHGQITDAISVAALLKVAATDRFKGFL